MVGGSASFQLKRLILRLLTTNFHLLSLNNKEATAGNYEYEDHWNHFFSILRHYPTICVSI
jgi:hypothetical protein